MQGRNNNVRNGQRAANPSMPKGSEPIQTTSREGTETMNQIYITGRLGRDPELRFSTSGMAVAEFSVAVTRKVKDEDETTWFDCVSFGEQAENYCEDFIKGSRIIVIGRIEVKEYTGKDGTLKKKTQIVVDEAGVSSRWKKRGNEQKEIKAITNAFPEADEEPF
jgi:single-strand DNA-binding protein